MFREQTLLGWMFVLTNFKIAKLRGGGAREKLYSETKIKKIKSGVSCGGGRGSAKIMKV